MIIINSNTDYNVLIGRMLILMQQLSFAKDNKSVLTIERIVIYDFFLRYPLLLVRAMKIIDKKIILDVKDNEVNTVQTYYPTYSDLYMFDTTKHLIQILYGKGLVDIEKTSEGELLISINIEGKLIASKLESPYFMRLREISMAIMPLHSTSFPILRNSINSLLYE